MLRIAPSEETTIGERIRQVRLLARMDQKDIAFHIGATVGTISNYENDLRSPSVEQINKINDAVKSKIGDHLFFLFTGQQPSDYLTAAKIQSNYVEKGKVLEMLETWLDEMTKSNEVRVKGKISELVSNFAGMFASDKTVSTKNGTK